MLIKKKRNKRRRLRLFIILLLLAAITIPLLEFRIKPIAASVAEIQARSMAEELIHQSVEDVLTESGIDTQSLEHVCYSSDGRIASVSSDTIKINRLKNAVTLRIQEKLADVQSRRLDIPLGTILGGELTNGQGPGLPLFISYTGSVDSSLEGGLESGGINQAVHTLSLVITADIKIIMPLGTTDTKVVTSVLISETTIVGDVPSGMLVGSSIGSK